MPSKECIFCLFYTRFGNFSLSCSFSPVEKHMQTLEGEESEVIVEPYQFEPEASKSLVGSLAATT